MDVAELIERLQQCDLTSRVRLVDSLGVFDVTEVSPRDTPLGDGPSIVLLSHDAGVMEDWVS